MRNRVYVELGILLGAVTLAVSLSAWFDVFERFSVWAAGDEHPNADESLAASLALVVGLALFGWRRYRDGQRESRRLEQTRAALQETNDRYRSLFTHNPHGVYSLDLNGRFESVNEAAQGLAGYRESDLLGKNFADLMAPDELEPATGLFLSAASGTPQQMQTAIHRADGSRVDLSVRVSPILVNDEIVGVYGVAEDITARKQMERQLQRTQEAVAVALDAVMIGDERNRVAYVNDAGVRAHGYESAAEMMGQPIVQFFDRVEEPRLRLEIVPTLDAGGRWTGQLTGRRRDATSYILEASVSRLPDGCVVAIGRDVTARVAAESALRESEERYRTVLADIAGGYFETDRDGHITFLNDALAAIAGGTPEEVLGTSAHSYVAADAVDTVLRHAERVRRTGRTDPGFDWHLVRRDGSRRLVSTSLAVVRGAEGEVVAFRGLIRDVTDLAETQSALVLSEERHRLVARVTREVLWEADANTGRMTWSGAVREVFGIPEDELEVGAEWLSRIHPDDASEVAASIEAALASTEDRWSHEYRVRDHSERYVTVLSRGRILRDPDGRVLRFLGSMLDVTEFRRQADELRLARRLAEAANEAKSLFLANMSHELRTPLTTVLAGTEMLLDTPLSAPQQRLLERVSRSGERLLKLVDDLLDFSAIETGGLRMDSVPFDPSKVVQQTAAWARDACTDKDLEFEVSAPDLPRSVLGDPDRLRQVLTNLLGNAVKFTRSGSVRLAVTTSGNDAGRVQLRFSVEDTGIGIGAQHHADIFESFRQADPSITRHYGGNGLGLAISKEIVEHMGGNIEVDSEPGRGSTFVFEVPFRCPPTDDGDAPTPL